MPHLLIIEDDDNLARGVSFAFQKEGFLTTCTNTLQSAKNALKHHNFDIVILDLNLPDGDGIEFCCQIRETSNTPIVMLTARDLETDEVQGLSAGADDYITKPFSLAVLRARIAAVLRRRKNASHIIQSMGYTLDTALCKLFKGDVEIPISATEFRLLNYFMDNAGQILSKEQILALWDSKGSFVDENTLAVNISRLRTKIEDNPKRPKIIKNIRGMGYVWTKE
ncbi:MAG: response regulator transcription factor [Defluviitaleaceae bacterium]|nr:response regulator transcription factor [Defluviitaleaceae bacterium]